jgi:RNA polymerase sigma-70 factor, ECF subfamily
VITSPPVFLPLTLDDASALAAAPAVKAVSCDYPDIATLTCALRVGKEEAFRQLYAGWNGRLFRYCFVLAQGDGVLAGDVAQAVYLRVARHMRQLPDSDALWAWLARAARSAAVDLRRTGGRYGRALERFAEWLGRTGDPTGVGDDPTEARALAALDRVLEALESEQRRLIELRYFSGHSLDEIARALDISPRAVEGRLARLRAALRDALRQQLSFSDETERPS